MDANLKKRIEGWDSKEDAELCISYLEDGESKTDERRIRSKRIKKLASLFAGTASMIKAPISSILLTTEKEILPKATPELFGLKYGVNDCSIKSHEHDKKNKLLEVKPAQSGIGFQVICHDNHGKEEVYANAIQYQMAKEGCTKERAIFLTSMLFIEQAVLLIRDARNPEGTEYAFSYRREAVRNIGSLYVFITTDGKYRGMEFADKELKQICRLGKLRSQKTKDKPIFNEEELKEMVDNCEGDLFSMSFLQLLYSSAMRISEMMSLEVGDISFEGFDVNVHVRPNEGKEEDPESMEADTSGNKSGERRIPVQCQGGIQSLQKYIEQHPLRKPKEGLDPKTPLWISKNTMKIPSQKAIEKRIRRIVTRMNEKREKDGIPLFKALTNVHNFRHSMSTILAVEYDYSEEQLRAYRGDSEKSTQPAHYCHLKENFELMKKIRDKKNRDRGDNSKEVKTEFKTCPQCKKAQFSYNTRCGVCNYDFERVDTVKSMLQMQIQFEAQAKELQELKKSVKDNGLLLSKLAAEKGVGKSKQREITE